MDFVAYPKIPRAEFRRSMKIILSGEKPTKALRNPLDLPPEE